MNKKPFVKVTWHDAEDHGGTWVDDDDAQQFGSEPLVVISWGWIVRRKQGYVTLAADYIEQTNTWGRVTKIPTLMIQDIQTYDTATGEHVPQPKKRERKRPVTAPAADGGGADPLVRP